MYYYGTYEFNKLYNYTELFENIEEAEQWYNDCGKWLEKKFNRVLILTKFRQTPYIDSDICLHKDVKYDKFDRDAE